MVYRDPRLQKIATRTTWQKVRFELQTVKAKQKELRGQTRDVALLVAEVNVLKQMLHGLLSEKALARRAVYLANRRVERKLDSRAYKNRKQPESPTSLPVKAPLAPGVEGVHNPQLHQPGGGPNTSTALRPPNANELDMV
jgi:hypothetical protein